jgi:hypothetical protein
MAMTPQERELAIEIAAQDSDLRALYELEIFDATHAVSPTRAEQIESYDGEEVLQLRHNISRTYGLGEQDMTKTIARCVGAIAGIRIGKDFFRDV